MRKWCISSIVLLFLLQLGCITFPTSRYFAPPDTVERVADHIVSIAVYYYMPESEYRMRIQQSSPDHRVIVKAYDDKGRPIPCIAYIGSGTIVKNNHIVTVKHLFDHDTNTYRRDIWVMKQGVDHAIRAELIAISEGLEEYDDYAVIKMAEDLGLPGIPISKEEPKRGEKVMFGCSVGGSAFFLRFGWMSQYKYFFYRGEDGALHLTSWWQFAYNTVYPSGPGDSGSGIFNINGELIGIMYCGINVYEEMYCFANPIGMLREFLDTHGLKWLLK